VYDEVDEDVAYESIAKLVMILVVSVVIHPQVALQLKWHHIYTAIKSYIFTVQVCDEESILAIVTLGIQVMVITWVEFNSTQFQVALRVKSELTFLVMTMNLSKGILDK